MTQVDKTLRLNRAMESDEFKILLELAVKVRNTQYERAQRVFEAFLKGNEQLDFDDPSDSASRESTRWASWMTQTIGRDLDHLSIGPFVELVLQFHHKAGQVAKAQLRHAENHAMRDQIYKWLDLNKTPKMTLDDAAEAMAGKLVPLKFRAVRQHVGAWKKLRSAGKT